MKSNITVQQVKALWHEVIGPRYNPNERTNAWISFRITYQTHKHTELEMYELLQETKQYLEGRS